MSWWQRQDLIWRHPGWQLVWVQRGCPDPIDAPTYHGETPTGSPTWPRVKVLGPTQPRWTPSQGAGQDGKSRKGPTWKAVEEPSEGWLAQVKCEACKAVRVNLETKEEATPASEPAQKESQKGQARSTLTGGQVSGWAWPSSLHLLRPEGPGGPDPTSSQELGGSFNTRLSSSLLCSSTPLVARSHIPKLPFWGRPAQTSSQLILFAAILCWLFNKSWINKHTKWDLRKAVKGYLTNIRNLRIKI